MMHVKIGDPLVHITPINTNVDSVIENGRRLRDNDLWVYPILPGAVTTYIDLASSRHWTVTGPPRKVSRAVDLLNNAKCYDFTSGITHTGFTDFEQRRVLDYLTIGRTALKLPKDASDDLEYLDPAYLRPYRARRSGPVKPNDYAWEYVDGRRFRARDVVFHHPVPIGASNFVAPLFSIVPYARLAYLLREHDMAKLDGRKMRDILFVGNAELSNSIETALRKQAAMAQGVDFSEVGIPIVEINNPSGMDIARQIHRLGLSEIPENFDRADFVNLYVNAIAGCLGLAIRHIWTSETSSSNRALEEIQEARQQQKGPAMFVRTEQRIMNNRGVFDAVAAPGTLRFAFIEETDNTSELTNARVLYNTALALERIQRIFGASIDLEAYLAWMQSLQLLPNDIRLVNKEPERVIENSDPKPFPEGGDRIYNEGLAFNEARPQKAEPTPDYGEVTMVLDYNVVDRRVKPFSVLTLFKKAPNPTVSDDAELFASLMKEGEHVPQDV